MACAGASSSASVQRLLKILELLQQQRYPALLLQLELVFVHFDLDIQDLADGLELDLEHVAVNPVKYRARLSGRGVHFVGEMRQGHDPAQLVQREARQLVELLFGAYARYVIPVA